MASVTSEPLPAPAAITAFAQRWAEAIVVVLGRQSAVLYLSNAQREQLSGFPAEVDDEALSRFFMRSGTDLASARRHCGDGNQLGWSLWLCGLRILGFCPDDVITALACRLDASVFSPLMLLPALVIGSVPIGSVGVNRPG